MSVSDKSFFRSEEMSLCQIYIKKDAAYSCICELGELGLVHFNNLHEGENVMGLRFFHQISHCAEMQRIVRFLRQEVQEAGIRIPEIAEERIPAAPQGRDMVELRTLLENMEAELVEITRNYEALRYAYFNLLEINAVLEKADEFFLDASTLAWSDSLTKTLLLDTNDLRGVQSKKEEGLKLGYLTGTIPIENFFAFERVLWRVCRGNFFIRHAEIVEEYNDESVKKFVFMVFFQGDVIEKKVRKICQGFRTSLYQCPESAQERLKQLDAMEIKIKDLQIVLEQTDYHRRRVLSAAATDLSLWRVRVKKVMAVYYIMNQMSMDDQEKYLIAECWIPTADVALIQHSLYRGAVKAGSSVPPILTQIKKKGVVPPTYNRNNRMTYGFQMLVDSYGVGDYRELNPAPYTIVTFPFLFAVMFGDLGHGILVSVFGTWMVLREKVLAKKKIDNEIWNIIFGGRYIILAMGMFSMYTGIIYNDLFSKAFNLFGSSWRVRLNESTILSNHEIQLNPETAMTQGTYLFGLDPVWDVADESAIVVVNSLKMKVAIILGVVHMFFGLSLAAWNHVFFKNYIDLLGMCIPQMLFFSIFLYLAILIFLKWSWYSAANSKPYNSHCAPSILITFIDMVLFKESGPVPEGCQRFMFKYQGVVQTLLMTIAVLCIPVMLLSKPLYLYWKKKQVPHKGKQKLPKFKPPPEKKVTFSSSSKQNGGDDGLTVRIVSQASNVDDRSSSSTYSIDSDEEATTEHWNKMDMSEVFIHQGIHTIECVLGSVSHTASYLRLWALSLAHDQLSDVLWEMVLAKGFHMEDWKGGIVLTFTFMAWSVLTFSILILMEGLSAFLHTLRLHWVEFQSKFYTGTGSLFQPFDFKKVLEVDDDEE